MDAAHRMARAVLEDARRMFVDNVDGLKLGEMLEAAGGYRSILGLMKHVAGWAAVYHSYAFEAEPRHWGETDWPRGLLEEIDPSDAYVAEVRAWYDRSVERWLADVEAADLDEPRPVHWGQELPLREIVAILASHWTYHAGEINEILAIRRGEAFEYGEQVEENHISTVGHRVRRPWMSDEYVAENGGP
jgi:uncharacterized damage-inducible protein DinB